MKFILALHFKPIVELISQQNWLTPPLYFTSQGHKNSLLLCHKMIVKMLSQLTNAPSIRATLAGPLPFPPHTKSTPK